MGGDFTCTGFCSLQLRGGGECYPRNSGGEEEAVTGCVGWPSRMPRTGCPLGVAFHLHRADAQAPARH
eukprot:7997955-Pyramimonas_sp.AAC.1